MPRSSAAQHLAPDPDAEPVRVAEARGSTIVDEDGREYIDLLAGWCVANLGWAHPDIRRAMRRYDGPDYVLPHYEHGPRAQLAEKLVRIAPGTMGRAFRATGGSEAVDIALQAAMLATKRSKFVALEDSYHGNTLATLGIAGSAPDGMMRGMRRIKAPLDEKALARLETALKRRDVAALVMEPIPTALGVEVPSEAFMEGAQRLCRRYGTLLVLDEVATGFGRTGRMFAAEHYDIEPDAVCLAKAITSGYAPMGATLMTETLARKVGEKLQSYSTYGWHPLAIEAALANLAVWERDGSDILRNVEARGEQLRERLEELALGDVRQKGLAVAVKMRSEAAASRLVDRCRREGVLLTSSGETLQIFPPLVITHDEVETALVGIERAA